MNVEHRDPVLRRKLAPKADPVPAAEPAVAGAAAGLRRAFARAVSDAAPLVADAGAIRRQTVTESELLDMTDGDSFVGLLVDANGETGLALMDQSGFSAVIEAMTIGRLAPRAPIPRRPTTTDASLLAELLDATLDGMADSGLSTLRFLRAVADHRLLSVLIDDIDYDFVSADFSLMSGEIERPAVVAFALPRQAVPDSSEPVPVGTDAGSGWAQALESSVMAAPACLHAELGRVTMPLAQVLDLGVGGTLTLPLSNLEDIQLVALDGRAQAVGRLGQSRGNRAVRLTSWPGGMPVPTEMVDAQPPGAAATQERIGSAEMLAASAPAPNALDRPLSGASGSGPRCAPG